MTAGRTDDLEALRIEIDTNWCRDARGRLSHERVHEPALRSAPYLVWAASPAGSLIELGAEVPDETARVIRKVHDGSALTPIRDPAAPPPEAADYRALVVGAMGISRVARVPCWVIEAQPEIEVDPVWRSRAGIVRSVDDSGQWDRGAVPRGHIDERRGPWAGVEVGDAVVSVCSTARSSSEGAEAGTWTHPDYRGHGFATAATATWASMLLGEGRLLFYCTDHDNSSSRAVASRLGLRSIGWMWRLDPLPEPGG